MWLLSIYALLLINPSISTCAAGCLKCNASDECIFSDATNFYRLDGATAEQVSVPNCISVNMRGECLSCKEDYYLDTSTNKCVLVPENSLIDDCILYSSANSCFSCESGFFLTQNICASIENTIANCDVYADATTCRKCRAGYLLYFDSLSCVPAPSTPNCSNYSFVKCKECNSGYVLSSNDYLNTFLRVSTTMERNNLALYVQDIVNGPTLAPEIPCEIASTNNCSEFDQNKNKCLVCNEGYFITEDNFCIQFPNEPINGCLHYSSTTTCAECISGFYFKSGICTEIGTDESIDHCQEYNGKSNAVTCIKCADEYYLDNNNCKERVKSKTGAIADCATTNITADNCQACTSNFILTTDDLECVPRISNCISYEPISSGQRPICTACNSGYYIEETTETVEGNTVTTYQCRSGNIDNCDKYDDSNSDICEVCINHFVLDANQCIRSTEITGCVEYSSSVFNTCKRCDEAISFNFKIEGVCQTVVNKIPRCARYSSGTINSPVCGKCEPGYVLDNNTCVEIPILDCLEIEESSCTLCAQGFAVSSDGNSCVRSLGHIAETCEEISTDQTTNDQTILEVTCNVCKEGAVPYNFLDHFACISFMNLRHFSTTNAIIDGCLKYNENIECVQCDPSGNTPFLKPSDSPPSCSSQCQTNSPGPHDKILMELDTSTGVKGEVKQYNVCRTSSVSNNCLIHGPDISDDGAQICIGCDNSSIPYVFLTATKYSVVDPEALNLDSYVPSPLARFPNVNCGSISEATSINGTGTATIPPFCEYYIATNADDGVYGCVKCQHRYSSIPNTSGYLNDCALDNSFSTEFFYNLDLLWVKTISVHKCSSDDSIPFIGYSGDSISDPTFTGFKRWNSNLDGGSQFANEAGEATTIVCAENSAESFGISEENYGVADNCGIGAIQVDTDGTGDNNTNFGSYCAACKPGFKSTSQSTFVFVKTNCEPIQNCSPNSTMFNACSKCNTGYIHKYDTTVDFTICLAIPSSLTSKLEYCWAATESSDNNTEAEECKVCQKGFVLNFDGFCEKLTPTYCNDGEFRLSDMKAKDHWNWSLWQSNEGVGCNKCSASYAAVKIKTEQAVCISSTWQTSTVDTLTKETSNFIPHCKNYIAHPSTLLCKKCDADYVMKGTSAEVLTNTECFPDTDLPFCEVASSPSDCLKCVSNKYALKSNRCELGSIENCVAYFHKENNSTVKCATCDAGYYLNTSTNTCEVGFVHNCLELEDNQPKKCRTCQPNFTKIAIGDDVVYCYPNEPSLGCAEYNITDDALGGAVSCNGCVDEKSMLLITVSASASQTICMQFGIIQNCRRYDLGSTLTTSSFNCVECEPDYYLSSNVCIERTNTPLKCEEFNPIDDKCKLCGSDSYINPNGTECIDYPRGIIGCRTYSDAETCDSCRKGRYLSDNACLNVEDPIENCMYYSSSTTCSECEANHFLVNNTCTQASATDCLTYTSALACATCRQGMVLETSNGVTSCINMTKTGCIEIDINSPHNCLKCSETYYLDAGDCEKADEIENCVAYENKTTCQRCASTYVLSIDQTSCVGDGSISAYVNNQCVDSQLSQTPVCTRCVPGYYFVDGECTGTCDPSNKGCFACKPNEPEVCFMCSPDYFQDKEGRCTFYGTVSDVENRVIIIQIVLTYLAFLLI